MNAFYKRLKEDPEFAKKISETTDLQTRQQLLKDEGYDVKDVHDFMQRIRDDADFMEKLSALETMDDKIDFIVESGYYFTKADLEEEQERIAEEEFDTLAGAKNQECGAIWEGHCGFTCEPETWLRDSGCHGYFKCTWG